MKKGTIINIGALKMILVSIYPFITTNNGFSEYIFYSSLLLFIFTLPSLSEDIFLRIKENQYHNFYYRQTDGIRADYVSRKLYGLGKAKTKWYLFFGKYAVAKNSFIRVYEFEKTFNFPEVRLRFFLGLQIRNR